MDEFEAIKQQMESRRSSLAEKLEALECQVAEGVQGVTSAVSNVKEVVQDTVQTVKGSVESVKDSVQWVKDSVQDTVGAVKDSVKDTFDFQRQMDNHPWIMLGGAVALGFVAGRVMPDVPWPASDGRAPGLSEPDGADGRRRYMAAGVPIAQPSVESRPVSTRSEPTWIQNLTRTLGPEIDKLKSLALGAALGLVRDYVKKSVPPDLGNQLAGMIDNATSKLGGQPVRDNLADIGRSYRFSETR